MGPLQGVLAPFGALVGPPGAFSGRGYGFSHFWSPSWAPLVAVLELSRAVLGACWAVFGLSWRVLGPSWGLLGHLWPSFVASWGVSERREAGKARVPKTLPLADCNERPLATSRICGGSPRAPGVAACAGARLRLTALHIIYIYIYNVTNVNGRATCVCGRSTVAAGSLERAATGDLPQLVQLREVLSGQTTGGEGSPRRPSSAARRGG